MLFIILINMFTFLGVDLHPIHVSKCQIEHDIDSRHLQVTLHVYIDDLETVMKDAGMDSLYLGTEFESPDASEKVGEYLQSRFQMAVNGKLVPMTFLGKEMSDDYAAFWCYLESKQAISGKEVEINFNLLMDLYDDQKNIVNFIRRDRSEEYELLHVNKHYVKIDM